MASRENGLKRLLLVDVTALKSNRWGCDALPHQRTNYSLVVGGPVPQWGNKPNFHVALAANNTDLHGYANSITSPSVRRDSSVFESGFSLHGNHPIAPQAFRLK